METAVEVNRRKWVDLKVPHGPIWVRASHFMQLVSDQEGSQTATIGLVDS